MSDVDKLSARTGSITSTDFKDFTSIYDFFKTKVDDYKTAVDTATKEFEAKPTDPAITLKLQAAQGDLGTVTRGVGSLISALVSLQSEITQKIK